MAYYPGTGEFHLIRLTQDRIKLKQDLEALQLFTQEFFDTVCVPLEDAEFFSNVPIVIQKL